LNSIKFRHAAALALVGWYLMIPPVGSDGTVDTEAPLGKWKISSSYDNARECNDVMLAAQGYMPDSQTGKKGPVTDNPRLLSEACISTDDPRLAK
jgi:hypothetical protein